MISYENSKDYLVEDTEAMSLEKKSILGNSVNCT